MYIYMYIIYIYIYISYPIRGVVEADGALEDRGRTTGLPPTHNHTLHRDKQRISTQTHTQTHTNTPAHNHTNTHYTQRR
jgi:hypothetical protein